MKLRILYAILFVSTLISCNPRYTEQTTEYKHYALQNEKEDKILKSAIASYAENVKKATEKIIAVSTGAIIKDEEQSALGNLICDAMKFSAQAEFKQSVGDVVICNRGGMRATLPEGEIRVRNIFEVMPFDNELVMLTITGKKLLEGLNTIIEKYHPFLGLQLKIKDNVVLEALINNETIDPAKTYNVITSDYVANGGDNFTFLQNSIETKRCDLKIRDAIINYCIYLTENGKQLVSYTDDRLIISK